MLTVILLTAHDNLFAKLTSKFSRYNLCHHCKNTWNVLCYLTPPPPKKSITFFQRRCNASKQDHFCLLKSTNIYRFISISIIIIQQYKDA
jgi:hypothetical protein